MKTTIHRVFKFVSMNLQDVINMVGTWFIIFGCSITILMSSCTRIDKYAGVTDWLDRQEIVISLFNEGKDDQANKLLYLWLSEPSVRQADLSMLNDSLVFFHTTSPNGKLDVFSWYSGRDGLVTSFNNVILYEDGDKVYSSDKCLWQLMDRQHGTSELALGEGDLGAGCLTTDIHQVNDNNGRTIYLTENYLLDGTWAYGSIDGFFIHEGKFCQVPDFFITHDNKILDNLQYSYYVSTYNNKIESILGPQSIFGYINDENKILVPLEEFDECSDRYESFLFNGSKYVSTGKVAGKYLYAELRNFEVLEHLYWVGDYLIRVDRMKDESYRYAAWKLDGKHPDNNIMVSEPETVVHNGNIVEDKWYEFNNGNYTYRVNAYPSAWHQLMVFHNGQEIMDEIRNF